MTEVKEHFGQKLKKHACEIVAKVRNGLDYKMYYDAPVKERTAVATGHRNFIHEGRCYLVTVHVDVMDVGPAEQYVSPDRPYTKKGWW